MLIKSADDKTKDLELLESLLSHPDATKDKQKLIEQQIRNIRAGIKGEAEAAYEINFHLKDSANWAVIHDLRIVVGGNVAQIDHLILSRTMDMYVCESKHFSEGVAINEQGEFTAFYKTKPYGVPSPIAQNERHISALKDFFKLHSQILPARLGFFMNPTMCSLVLVCKQACISRPKTTVRGIDSIIKSDQILHRIEHDVKTGRALAIVKAISSETLQQFAKDIAAKHAPISFDWHAKFGLRKDVHVEDVRPVILMGERAEEPVVSKPLTTSVAQRPVKDELVLDAVETVASVPKEKKKLICMKCDAAIEYKVARVCWFNKKRFGGNAYCVECQTLFPK